MGAALEDEDSIGQTAMFYAVCHQFSAELVTALLSYGAKPSHHRKSKSTSHHGPAVFRFSACTKATMGMGL